MSEWVSCLAIIDVSSSFTHILTFCCCSYTDQWMGRDTHISSGEKKAQFKESSSVKVHEWVSCLAVVDVNNSFTHIHNPLLLLIHRSMDGRYTHSSSQKKAQFKESSSVKVHQWVSCLAVVDVNNSFTHIHNPLLLLIHRLMDGKGHACKLWSHWPCYNSTVQARGLCGSNPACEECLLFLHADPHGLGKQDRAEELSKDQQCAM